MVERERLNALVRRNSAEQNEAAFCRCVFRVELERGLQTIDALLVRFHGGAHPNPVGRVVLICFQQARQNIFGAGFIALAQRTDGILEHGILRGVFGHRLTATLA